MKGWINKDTYLPAKVEIITLIEMRPGDVPGLTNDFEKLTLDIKSQATFHDYGGILYVALPQASSTAQETKLGRLGVNEYLSYTPPQSALPSLEKEGDIMQWPAPPEMTIDPDKSYAATIKTNYGDMVVQLFAKDAPITVNNFVFLARQGFYDGVKFHRIIKGFVIQTGDPTGIGIGDAGYKFGDEKVVGDYYPGTLAMANAGANTNGSQFFITLDDLSGQLPKSYTIFGRVTSGPEVAQKIGDVPVTKASNGEVSRPTVDVYITSVTIEDK